MSSRNNIALPFHLSSQPTCVPAATKNGGGGGEGGSGGYKSGDKDGVEVWGGGWGGYKSDDKDTSECDLPFVRHFFTPHLHLPVEVWTDGTNVTRASNYLPSRLTRGHRLSRPWLQIDFT